MVEIEAVAVVCEYLAIAFTCKYFLAEILLPSPVSNHFVDPHREFICLTCQIGLRFETNTA